MNIAYPNVADRLFGRAHAIEPNALRAIIEGPVGQRVLAGERSKSMRERKPRRRRVVDELSQASKWNRFAPTTACPNMR